MAAKKTTLKSAADNAKAVKLEKKVKTLQSQLTAEKKAHGKTILQLEDARGAKKPLKIKAKAPRARRKKDIVEIISGDWHGAKVDPKAFGAFLQDVKAINPDRAVLGGDILDCGGYLAAHHTMGYIAETQDSYEDDVITANSLLDQFQEVTGGCETHYIEGNHEARVEKNILTQLVRANAKDLERRRRQDAAEFVLRVKERGFKFYSYSGIHEPGLTRGWMSLDNLLFTHKISNAKNAVRAAVEKTAANVMFFDTHRPGYTPVRKAGTGLIAGWNTGCLCKLQPLYAHTNYMEWSHGYCVRFIAPSGAFQVINVAIDEGRSFGDIIFNSPRN
jgi:hypothetical protein